MIQLRLRKRIIEISKSPPICFQTSSQTRVVALPEKSLSIQHSYYEQTWQTMPPKIYFQFSASKLSSVVISAQNLFHNWKLAAKSIHQFTEQQQTKETQMEILPQKKKKSIGQEREREREANLWSLATNVKRHLLLYFWQTTIVPYYITSEL